MRTRLSAYAFLNKEKSHLVKETLASPGLFVFIADREGHMTRYMRELGGIIMMLLVYRMTRTHLPDTPLAVAFVFGVTLGVLHIIMDNSVETHPAHRRR